MEIFEDDEKAIQKELEEQEKAAAERLRQRKNASIPEQPFSEVFINTLFWKCKLKSTCTVFAGFFDDWDHSLFS